MTSNVYLRSLRLAKSWSLKEAEKQTHISRILLYLYEQGYLSLPKKLYPDLALVYGVSIDSFNDVLNYPTPIEEDKKPSPRTEKFKVRAISWPSLIGVFTLFALCLGLFLWGYLDLEKAGYQTEQAYDGSLQNLTSLVRANGSYNEEKSTYTAGIREDDKTLLVQVSSDKRLVTSTAFVYRFSRSEQDETITFTLAASGTSPIFSLVEEDATLGLTTYTGAGRIENDHYILESLLDMMDEEVVDEATLAEKQSLVSSYESVTAPLFADWASIFKYIANVAPNDLVALICEGNASLQAQINRANNLLLVSTLLGVVFLFLAVLLSTFKLVAHKKKKVYELPESEPDLAFLPPRQPAPLTPNPRYLQPFIPETFFRLAGVVLILSSSILLFRIAYAVLHAEDIFEIIIAALGVMDWIKLLPLIPLATTLWFFIRIEILHTSKNVIPTALLSFFLGLLYYFAENAFVFYFQLANDSYRATLLELFLEFMPGNLFWGMGASALIVLFLLTTPKFKKKSALVGWRLLALLPISYLLLSYFYAVGTTLWGWPLWDSDWSNLLFRKQIIATTFAILYPLSLYLYRLLASRKYGPERAPLYFQGNRYFFIKNVIACAILGALAIASYALKDTATASTLGLKGSYWVAVLIPFILFYHPHLGERNKILDLVFPLAYVVSLTFAYLYIARFLLFLV
jgi:transcriptional regulator with XRE-family HTH domain